MPRRRESDSVYRFDPMVEIINDIWIILQLLGSILSKENDTYKLPLNFSIYLQSYTTEVINLLTF